ncbi:hypothetical protein E6W39_09430 [Kitasatospora acidiphila]|uniref:Uncharacterized protein n=1 Tax=Kitasatospora acidiphila TaxID=2567942 RepID=A0A540W0A1_9ACTN|nr:hypothetical protein E6W39_09430 [Kitasatospora acidiphila]
MGISITGESYRCQRIMLNEMFNWELARLVDWSPKSSSRDSWRPAGRPSWPAGSWTSSTASPSVRRSPRPRYPGSFGRLPGVRHLERHLTAHGGDHRARATGEQASASGQRPAASGQRPAGRPARLPRAAPFRPWNLHALAGGWRATALAHRVLLMTG